MARRTESDGEFLLAAVGHYGLMSYSVSRRAQKIGIRVTLGANPGDMTRMVLRQATWIGLSGLVAGLALTWALTRFLRSILYDVGPTDPVTLGAVCLLLSAVAPASRATRITVTINSMDFAVLMVLFLQSEAVRCR